MNFRMIKKIVSLCTILLFVCCFNVFACDDKPNKKEHRIHHHNKSKQCIFMPNPTIENAGNSKIKNSNLSEVNPSQSIVDSFNSERSFHVPTEINFPMLPSYFGPTSPSFNFQSAENMTLYKRTFTRSELEMMAKKTGFRNPVIIVRQLTDMNNSDIPVFNSLTVYLTKPIKKDIIPTANITISLKTSEGVSIEAFGMAGLAALDAHANALHITSEGAARIAKCFSWGIGANISQADMKDNGSVSTISSGGMGISGGEFSTIDKPWLQATALIIME